VFKYSIQSTKDSEFLHNPQLDLGRILSYGACRLSLLGRGMFDSTMSQNGDFDKFLSKPGEDGINLQGTLIWPSVDPDFYYRYRMLLLLIFKKKVLCARMRNQLL
jgi:hypothetical protein